ncbi:hypothetical protein TYRP_017315 [Tyrophagus putrescentiae]|nr:hypothetical protein TYRP_017315 [Tyrophagus putrescentiae]
MKHYNYEDDLSVLYTKFSANRRVQDQVFAELDKIPSKVLETVFGRFPQRLGFKYIEELGQNLPRLEPYVASIEETLINMFRRDALNCRKRAARPRTAATTPSTPVRPHRPVSPCSNRVVRFTDEQSDSTDPEDGSAMRIQGRAVSANSRKAPPGLLEGPCSVTGCGEGRGGKLYCYRVP